MTFNVPVQAELVSTDVVDTTPIYDPSATYTDGYEVKQDGSIYAVVVTQQSEVLPEWSSEADYAVGGRFKIGALVYETIADRTLAPSGDYTKSMPLYVVNAAPPYIPPSTQYILFGDAAKALDSGLVFIYDFTVGSTARYSFQLISGDSYNKKMEIINSSGEVTSTTNTTVTLYLSWSPDIVQGEYFVHNGILYEAYRDVYWYSTPNIDTAGYVLSSTVYTQLQSLSYLRPTLDQLPFDTRQYTSVVVAGPQSWTIKALSAFDGVALGYLRGDTVSVVFKDSIGTVVTTVSSNAIDGSIDAHIDDERISDIIYAGQFIEANGTIEITIDGTETEVGMIFPTASMFVGGTNLSMSHDIINFDRQQVSAISGYVDHITGNRVIDHKGSFDIEMLDYDRMVRLNKKLTQQLIAIDGSDTTGNEAADGVARFASTKIIGRVRSLKMKSDVKDGDLRPIVPVSFEFREIV